MYGGNCGDMKSYWITNNKNCQTATMLKREKKIITARSPACFILRVVRSALIINTMLKRKFDSETYAKMGRPGLGSKIYFMKTGKKVWGTVSLLSFCGFNGAKNGLILLGLEPFKKHTDNY